MLRSEIDKERSQRALGNDEGDSTKLLDPDISKCSICTTDLFHLISITVVFGL